MNDAQAAVNAYAFLSKVVMDKLGQPIQAGDRLSPDNNPDLPPAATVVKIGVNPFSGKQDALVKPDSGGQTWMGNGSAWVRSNEQPSDKKDLDDSQQH